MTVLIAGGGISGLVLALSCHQVGIPFKVFEASKTMRPLGVGINLQPSAVRELCDLGLEDQLDKIGVKTRDYGMYSKKGLHIWTESRGTHLGYHWPQYSVHRGWLHMMLYETLVDRAGPEVMETGWRITGYSQHTDRAHLHMSGPDAATRTDDGTVVIGADGIHSALRKQMVPDEGPPHWDGVVLYRGTTQAKPFLSGASMVMIGHEGRRFVSYPISGADPATGLATINWIGCLKQNPSAGYPHDSFSREASQDDVLPTFEGFAFDWLDIPHLIRSTKQIFEYPMIDRDPLTQWTDGRVTLIGDAAHPAYPVGSNGAGAGILDARTLVAQFLQHGLTSDALIAFEALMLPPTTKMVLTNRSAGPDAILDVVEDRCGGQFERIEDVIPRADMDAHAETYKKIAGYGVADTNNRAQIIPVGARF